MGLWRKRIPFYCFIFKSFLWLPLFFFFLLLHGLHSFFLLLLRFRFNNNNKSLSLSAFRATSFLFLSLSALTAEQFLLFKLLEKCAKWYNRHFTLYTPTRTRDQTLHDIFKIEAISELYIYPLHIHFSFFLSFQWYHINANEESFCIFN